MPRKQTQKQTPPADTAAIDQQMATIDAERARLEGKLPKLAVALTAQQAAATAAEEEAAALAYRRDVLDELGLDDAIEAAERAADAARRAFRRAEHNQRTAHRDIAALRAERERAGQDRGRAEIAALIPLSVAAAAKEQRGLMLTVEGERERRELRARMLQIAVDANLPEDEFGKFNDHRAFRRKALWELGNAGLADRPASGHYLADVTLEDVESDILRGATPIATAADDGVIDAGALQQAGDAA